MWWREGGEEAPPHVGRRNVLRHQPRHPAGLIRPALLPALCCAVCLLLGATLSLSDVPRPRGETALAPVWGWGHRGRGRRLGRRLGLRGGIASPDVGMDNWASDYDR